MLIGYKRKNKGYPKGKILESIPSLDVIVNRFLSTGELLCNSQDTVSYDFDSNDPQNMDSVPLDKGLIDFVLEGKAAPSFANMDSSSQAQSPDSQSNTDSGDSVSTARTKVPDSQSVTTLSPSSSGGHVQV